MEDMFGRGFDSRQLHQSPDRNGRDFLCPCLKICLDASLYPGVASRPPLITKGYMYYGAPCLFLRMKSSGFNKSLYIRRAILLM